MTPTKANSLLLLAGAIWGMGFVAQRTAMDDVAPLLFIGCRFLLAGLVVLPLAFREVARNQQAFKVANFWHFAILGVVFFLGLALQQIGLMETTVTNAGFLTSLYVVIVPLVLVGVLRQRQPWLVWPSAALSLLGVYLLSYGGLAALSRSDGLIVACAAVWAVHVVLVGIISRKSALPITMACTQFFVCALLGFGSHVSATLLGLMDAAPATATLFGGLPEILYAGIVSGGIAFTLQAIGQQYTNSSVAAILMASESLFAAILGAILLGERLFAVGYVGCGLILVSIVAVEFIQSKMAARCRPEGAFQAELGNE